ncbi:sodium/glutamate symporter [Fusobacterium perfoetens]|uniref:sodium/glutamate symporter n=1 Tax=Fusobacterium perfoetens TaxID=852 RepID=UPI0004865401|nr:sodium/glutamate symporter [Fusobacterium perfoetens]MCI6151874.1 glutamate:sodium symporter [Fusobacterium perfoetens]MDY3236765.1 sodium/glutamate symporter [Fusobacterium perfoetens]
MTSAMLTDFLKSLGLLGAFLLLGVFIRANVKIFQKTFIPAGVIGGFLLLILGPQCINILPVPKEWFSIYSLLPGVLIVPVVAAVPLGLNIGSGKNTDSDVLKNVIPLIGIGLGASMFQFAVGYGTHVLFSGQDLYDVFGIELAIGFVGGHGTAGTLGNILSGLNLPYWQTSQGVATTTATFGIVGGILIGIGLINWAARHGHTALLKKPADIPEPLRIGYQKDMSKQNSIGRETTLSSSIDTVAFHAAIIFVACGLAYIVLSFTKKFKIPVLSSISVWAYAMIVMFIIWGIMRKLNLSYLVDDKVKSKISGSFTEYAVIAAIASLPIKAVAAYIVPILVMVVVGYIVTTGILFIFCKKYLKGYWFEQMIGTFGMSTGVFLTGVLLLRVCDPNLESPALANYSLSYTITSIIYFAMLNLFIMLPMSSGAGVTTMVATGIGTVILIATIISSRILFGKEFKGN